MAREGGLINKFSLLGRGRGKEHFRSINAKIYRREITGENELKGDGGGSKVGGNTKSI